MTITMQIPINQKNSFIYCSGYWALTKNPKHSFEHYKYYMPLTLNMISNRSLYFFTNEQRVLDNIKKCCESRDIQLTSVLIDIEHLPAWDIAGEIVECCERMHLEQFTRPSRYHREKGVIHYWRDLVDGGRDTYKRMLAIWLSKVYLASIVANKSQNSEGIAWIDMTLSRFNYKRENWDFSQIPNHRGVVSHYGSNMRVYGSRLPLNAAYLAAEVEVWTYLKNLFQSVLYDAKFMPYGHDEETVLGECVRRKPELFHCVGEPITSKSPGLLQSVARRIQRKMLRGFLKVRELPWRKLSYQRIKEDRP